MRAVVQSTFGPPRDVLHLREIERPAIKDDQVLVRVEAASIHIGDTYAIRGLPYSMRPLFRLMGAKNRVPGTDVAGTIEAVGANVTRFEPGDAVFGSANGAFAEYVSASEDLVVPRPANFDAQQASTLGVSALTALQAIREHGKVSAGQRVLITGASGGVGTFAVQIAKWLGADVTGVCSTRNVDMVRSIGADHVIDYTEEDFTTADRRYDLILDNVGAHSLTDTRKALAEKGVLMSNGTPISGWFGGISFFLKTLATSVFVKQQGRPFISWPTNDDLEMLKELAEAEKIAPVIEHTFPLERTASAVSHVAQGHAKGKTVITT
ncbi:MAG: NAD(P)-dependent alcohol dehydrogenase [Acidimicrobiia bacterium]|nr:NAD(P)-dependent alcohol dehydrogenase [Acidimicrobiia bacterium]